MRNATKGIKMLTEFLICMLCATVGIFVSPTVFNIVVDRTNSEFLKLILGISIFGFVIYLLITFLAWVERKGDRFRKIARKIFKLSIMYILCWLVVSLLFGLIATLSYFVLKQHLAFEQIKGIINFFTVMITFLILPCFVSVFWMTIKSDKQKWRDYLNAITLSSYFKLLIAILVLYGIGVLITTVFHYLPTGMALKILESVLLALVGVGGFTVTDTICQYKGGGKRI